MDKKVNQKMSALKNYVYEKKGLLILIIATLILFAYLFFDAKKKQNQIQKKQSQIRSKARRLEVKSKKNALYIKALEEDPEVIKKVAREKYNLGKEKEFIFTE